MGADRLRTRVSLDRNSWTRCRYPVQRFGHIGETDGVISGGTRKDIVLGKIPDHRDCLASEQIPDLRLGNLPPTEAVTDVRQSAERDAEIHPDRLRHRQWFRCRRRARGGRCLGPRASCPPPSFPRKRESRRPVSAGVPSTLGHSCLFPRGSGGGNSGVPGTACPGWTRASRPHCHVADLRPACGQDARTPRTPGRAVSWIRRHGIRSRAANDSSSLC